MKFDAAAIAKRSGKMGRRKSIDLNVISPTAALASDLASIYLRVVNAWKASAVQINAAYERTLAELPTIDRMTDSVSETDNLLTRTANAISALIIQLTPDIQNWAVRLEQWHERKWGAALTPAGVDISALIGPQDVRETLQMVLARNVGLVRSVSDDTRARIADIVFRGFQARSQAVDVAREISNATTIARKRSLRIASTQAVRLSASLDEERQRQAGITTYVWRHSFKLHPRPEHVARNGKVFKWADPPADGPPGTLPWCGCKAQARLSLEGDE